VAVRLLVEVQVLPVVQVEVQLLESARQVVRLQVRALPVVLLLVKVQGRTVGQVAFCR
jgi:hypothetical protein